MKERLESLQSLRLFAALGVFLFHLGNNYLGTPFSHPGTDYFILMVGVATAISQTPKIPDGGWIPYLWRRYLRLYVTFVPVYFLYLLAGSQTFDLLHGIKSFLFIPIADRPPLVPQTWMITNFLIFYWLFSITFLFRNEKIIIPVFAGWAAGCIYYALSGDKPGQYPELFNAIFDFRNLDFLLGYVAGKLITLRRVPVPISRNMLTLGITLLAWFVIDYNFVVPRIPGNIRVFTYGLPLFMIAIGFGILELNHDRHLLLRAARHPWLVWMGNTSYVLYLIHGILLRGWNTLVTAIIPIQVPLLVLFVLIASAAIHVYWEKPVLDYLHHKTLHPVSAIQTMK